MKRAPIRSTLFNLAYFGTTAALAILYIPALLLPHGAFIALVRFWLLTITFFEYTILNLKYEVRGLENLPKDGPFIIAAKHQSEYETMKIRLIFNDPAIVLKKELLKIPLWGWSLAKSGVIAIDRSTPERALRSLQNGALKMKEAGRPIVIFPQGTRVRIGDTTDTRPYKPGIARVQEVTGLPIIPMALNSGVYWPKNSWLKSSGTVIFELMRPIQPGKERQALMSELETKLENASNDLAADASRRLIKSEKHYVRASIIFLFLALILCGAYTWWWGKVERGLVAQYATLQGFRDAAEPEQAPLEITGFPYMRIHRDTENFATPDGNLRVSGVDVSGWPVPMTASHIQTGPITIKSFKWLTPLTLDGIEGDFRYFGDTLTILNSTLKKDAFIANVKGTIDFSKEPYPEADLSVSFKNHHVFMNELAAQGILDERTAVFMAAGFNALADKDGVVTVPVTQKGRTLYAGPFAVAELPEQAPPAAVISPPAAATEALPGPSQ